MRVCSSRRAKSFLSYLESEYALVEVTTVSRRAKLLFRYPATLPHVVPPENDLVALPGAAVRSLSIAIDAVWSTRYTKYVQTTLELR